ncbi:unnamed protein product [Spirodela intermedia]|uniref:Uncharacterized protein n=1 Tax=Spirodela intermedia TaxID=51605 RepID=A0A7I8KA97_SPIIN|nr:unnamed protein product [Spirodela intermedia]
MRRRCIGILSIREDRRVVSMASKALLGQGRCGRQLISLISKLRKEIWRLPTSSLSKESL